MASRTKNNATANNTNEKENTVMNNAIIETKNNAISTTSALDNALTSLGYEVLHTEDYAFSVEKEVDGDKVVVTVQTNDDNEKRAIDELQTFRNIATYSLPRQCALLAYLASKKTYETKGTTFKAYAKSIVNGQIADGTIQKYANIGKCFFKALDDINSPVVWVDDRLAKMNGDHGVSITNLDAILSTFKAYADNKEIDGASEYRDYVTPFLDEFCIDKDGQPARIPLEATLPVLREAIKKLNGKATTKKDKDKDKDKNKDNENDKTLNPFDGLVNALTRYKDSDKPNADLLTKVNDLLDYISNLPEMPEK